MEKLIIDRKTWLRGDNSYGGSMLFRPRDGLKCCLGFYCEANGIPKENLECVADPSCLFIMEQVSIPSWLFKNPYDLDISTSLSEDCNKLIEINDRYINDKYYISKTEYDKQEAQREQEIKEIFAKHDVEVEFV